METHGQSGSVLGGYKWKLREESCPQSNLKKCLGY